MRVLTILTVLLLAVGRTGPALEACPVDPALFDRLATWIERNTAYPVTALEADPPTIVRCSAGDVIDYEGQELLIESDLRALYDLDRRRIILIEPWDPDDPRDVSTLLHEMIHHVQWAEREWRCKTEPEIEAYRLQEAWLKEQGLESGFSWLFIYLRANCRDIHP